MYLNLFWGMVICLAGVTSFNPPAWADYESGHAAWEAGKYTEALAQWKTAAKAGDGRAMLTLGRAYVKGLGVPQDYVEAHKWLNLAAGRGNAEAANEREALAVKMTAEERAEAQRLARAWRSGSTVDAPRSVAVPQAAASSSPADPPPPRAIREAQALMAVLGYKPGPADGRWGPRTGRAYAAFMRDAGLSPANVLTPEALRALRAAAKGRAVAETATSPSKAVATQPKAAPPAADLHRAALAGDVDGLKAALNAGVDVNGRDSQGWTALMHAANKGYKLLLPPLLEAKADPDVQAADGATALFMAAVHGHSEIIALLMKASADASLKGPRGKTAADLACIKYGGLGAAKRNNESAEVLALVQQGRPTLDELHEHIRKKKAIMESMLESCGSHTVFSPYHKYEGYKRGTEYVLQIQEAEFRGNSLVITEHTRQYNIGRYADTKENYRHYYTRNVEVSDINVLDVQLTLDVETIYKKNVGTVTMQFFGDVDTEYVTYHGEDGSEYVRGTSKKIVTYCCQKNTAVEIATTLSELKHLHESLNR